MEIPLTKQQNFAKTKQISYKEKKKANNILLIIRIFPIRDVFHIRSPNGTGFCIPYTDTKNSLNIALAHR